MLLWILFVWLVWAPYLGFGSFSNHCFRRLLVFFFFSGFLWIFRVVFFFWVSLDSQSSIFFLSLIYILTFDQKKKEWVLYKHEGCSSTGQALGLLPKGHQFESHKS